MEAILKFDLENPDDRLSHLRCIKATDMAIVLFEITHNLKRSIEAKLDMQNRSEGYYSADAVLTLAFEEIAGILEDNGLNLEELIH